MAKMILKQLGFYHSKLTSSSSKHPPSVMEELCHQFSPADLRKSTNNFDESQIIGEGDFCKVYKGYLQHNGVTDHTLALKRMKKPSTSSSEEIFRKEIEMLCQLRHPNLVSLIGFCNHKDEKIIVYEYTPNGPLYDHLHNRDMKPLSWKKRLEICIGAARALHYLHSGTKRTILHCAIHPRSILLDNNMVPKLADFRLSLRGPHFTSKPKPIQLDIVRGITIGYIAPEYAMNFSVTDKCDVFSFGMVLLEVVCAMEGKTLYDFVKCPFPVEENIYPILRGKIAPECWEVFMDIMKRCLKYDPLERPIMGEVEVELERALSLQEEADIRNINGYYTLLSTTTIEFKSPELEQDTDIKNTDFILLS